MDGEADLSPEEILLARFLKSEDETESDLLLGRLMNEHASPLIKEIARSRLRNSLSVQDLEDIAGEVVLQLIKRLRDFKSHPEGPNLTNLKGYVAVAAYSACYRHLRQRYPQRSKLKDHLRYVLTHREGLAMWDGNNQETLCGFVDWREEGRPTCSRAYVDGLRGDTQKVLPIRLISSNAINRDLGDAIKAVFNWLGNPVELDDLVEVLSEITGRSDQTEYANEDLLSDSQTRVDARFEQQVYLKQLWNEIRELPIDQRHALLLSLRDDSGRGIITLFAHSRIATMREVADALAIKPEDLAALVSDLPLDDATIAQRLGISRQRVINLRSAARKRLRRRMARAEGAR